MGRDQTRALVAAFRFIVFGIMVAGLIACMVKSQGGGAGLFAPFVKAIIIVAAIAFMDVWFPKTEQVFLAVAEYIDPGYNENPTSASQTIRESTTDNPEGQTWSWRHINESIYQAVSRALANVFIYLGTLIAVPMHILQYVLRWLLYLLTPFMLALFMVPGFSGIAVRFLQQLLAILAWPIGFALTNLVALAVWNDFRGAVGANPTTVGDAMYSPLLTFMGGILATIMIIVGMLSTPDCDAAVICARAGVHRNLGQFRAPSSARVQEPFTASGDRLGRGRSAPLAAPAASQPSAPPTPPPMGMEPRAGI